MYVCMYLSTPVVILSRTKCLFLKRCIVVMYALSQAMRVPPFKKPPPPFKKPPPPAPQIGPAADALFVNYCCHDPRRPPKAPPPLLGLPKAPPWLEQPPFKRPPPLPAQPQKAPPPLLAQPKKVASPSLMALPKKAPPPPQLLAQPKKAPPPLPTQPPES